jgi:predicted acyl esterase
MFSTKWQTSSRQHGVKIERDVAIPVRDGVTLDSDIFRPDGDGKFPALLAVHAYAKPPQSMEIMPIGFSAARGFIETGDFNFYVRRGYALIIINITGSRASGGVFGNIDPQSILDVCEAIQWTAGQPWCDGNIGMTGISHFSRVSKRVAALNPPNLKAIFAPYGWTDMYRDLYYHGGIFNHGFLSLWVKNHGAHFHTRNTLKEEWGKEKYDEAIADALADGEINTVPHLVDALRNPDVGANSMLVDIIVNNLLTDFHKDRSVEFQDTNIPAYVGGDWGLYGLHFPGDIRAYENWKGPKLMAVGPPIYLDRPLYQYDYESLRWFDYWLKGIDTGIMDEAPVRLFIVGTDEWKAADDWPLPETKWTPFNLHRDGLLSEHEFFPNEGGTSFEDSPFHHGGVMFKTPPLVENTEICGPIVLNLYGSTDDTDVLWFVSLLHIDRDGEETLLTRGWLRGSQRALDAERSRPWQPVHRHESRDLLEPNEIYEFNIEIRPYGILVKAGERIAIRDPFDNGETSPPVDHIDQAAVVPADVVALDGAVPGWIRIGDVIGDLLHRMRVRNIDHAQSIVEPRDRYFCPLHVLGGLMAGFQFRAVASLHPEGRKRHRIGLVGDVDHP